MFWIQSCHTQLLYDGSIFVDSFQLFSMLATSSHTASCLPSTSENMLSPSCSPYFGQHGFRGSSFQIEGVPEVLREAKAIISCHMMDKAFRIGYRTFRIEQSMFAI